ncbi:hypothetical protein F4810DRAFT_262862 [Camillea tinctor]|nr:hypothetical protein F4810DRAFT_262862 [Camillea tinctor]
MIIEAPFVPRVDISTAAPQSYHNSDILSPDPSLLLPSAPSYAMYPSLSGTQTPMTIESSSDFSAPGWSSETSLMGDPAFEELTWQSERGGSVPSSVPIQPIDTNHIPAQSNVFRDNFPGTQYTRNIQAEHMSPKWPSPNIIHHCPHPEYAIRRDFGVGQASRPEPLKDDQVYNNVTYGPWPNIDAKGGDCL